MIVLHTILIGHASDWHHSRSIHRCRATWRTSSLVVPLIKTRLTAQIHLAPVACPPSLLYTSPTLWVSTPLSLTFTTLLHCSTTLAARPYFTHRASSLPRPVLYTLLAFVLWDRMQVSVYKLMLHRAALGHTHRWCARSHASKAAWHEVRAVLLLVHLVIKEGGEEGLIRLLLAPIDAVARPLASPDW